MSDTNSFSATMDNIVRWVRVLYYPWCYKGMKINVAILLKRLRSRDMANMHNQHWLTSTRFSPFSAPWTEGLCIQVQRCSKPTHDNAASL